MNPNSIGEAFWCATGFIPALFIFLTMVLPLNGIGIVGGFITGLSLGLACFAMAIKFIQENDALTFLCTPCVVFAAIGLWMMTKGYKKKNKDD